MIETDRNNLIDIFRETSKQLSKEPDRCGNLIYTQEKSNRRLIRDPEARHVLTRVLSQKNVDFGLEMPTKKKYSFGGSSPDTANIDLVIEPNKEQLNVELKEGQRKTIQKDFEKLLSEQVSGGAFYHVLQNSNSATLPALLNKYKEAYSNIVNLNDAVPKWFILFIFVKEKQECFWKAYDNITKIALEDFDQNAFSKKTHRLPQQKRLSPYCTFPNSLFRSERYPFPLSTHFYFSFDPNFGFII